MRWYFPTESGDIRLEVLSDDCTRLVVTDPTPREIAVLGKLLKVARTRDWLPPEAGIPAPKGTYNLDVSAKISDVAAVLIGKRRVPAGVIQGVAYRDGTSSVTLQGAALPTPTDPATPGAPKTPKKVITSPRPTLCCPNPWEGPDVRASEVLQAFCTPDEWEEWTRDGMIHVRGNLTGHTYRIVHRHHPLARRQGKITWDEDDDHVVHCHLSNLPPPEEVLSVKLTLQHGEDWIRNPSGYFGPGQRFAHPLGLGATEGLWSAAFIGGVGSLTPLGQANRFVP